MNWQSCSAALSGLIDQELVLAHELGLALAAEHDALSGLDSAALDNATVQKQRCVEQLAALDDQRKKLCTSIGVGADRIAMDQLLMQADPQGDLSQRWQTLLTRLEGCREANHNNGTVVRLQKRRVTEALGILRGGAANNAVYGDSGEVDNASGSHVHAEI